MAGDGGDTGTTIDMTATVVADQAELTPSAASLSFGNDVVGNAVNSKHNADKHR